MTLDEVMSELESLGNEQTKQTFLRHGAREPFFGVKIADLQAIRKRTKTDHELALELYDTGNSDAMYLAGMIADPQRMTKKQLRSWASRAYWHMIAEYTVAGIAADGPHGFDLGLEWIGRRKEQLRCCGWTTLTGVVSVREDDDLDLDRLGELLDDVRAGIHDAPDRVRYTMNGYVIGVGTWVKPLHARAKKVAKAIGTVSVDMGDTACKVPFAPDYIAKVADKGRVGKKRRMARCS